ncbi:Adenylosuccinate synthetase, partial [Frankliniella fusca]
PDKIPVRVQPGRHPGGTRETPEWYPGDTRETPGRHPETLEGYPGDTRGRPTTLVPGVSRQRGRSGPREHARESRENGHLSGQGGRARGPCWEPSAVRPPAKAKNPQNREGYPLCKIKAGDPIERGG